MLLSLLRLLVHFFLPLRQKNHHLRKQTINISTGQHAILFHPWNPEPQPVFCEGRKVNCVGAAPVQHDLRPSARLHFELQLGAGDLVPHKLYFHFIVRFTAVLKLKAIRINTINMAQYLFTLMLDWCRKYYLYFVPLAALSLLSYALIPSIILSSPRKSACIHHQYCHQSHYYEYHQQQ